MFERTLLSPLKAAALQYPVVTVTGPRQAGKTLLVRRAFPEKAYVNLEQPDVCEAALADPRHFLEVYREGAILDEIQNAPALMSYIQVMVDEDQKDGQFILTGSHQLSLHQAVTQSLAGRTAMLNLLPLSLDELQSAGLSPSLHQVLLNGFYPRIYDKGLTPTAAYRDYFQTYIERDVRQLINVKDLRSFQNFIRLFAGRIGQLLNANSLASEVGVSHNTIKHWISILEASFVVFRLEPYFTNISKRVVKSPKYYFCDCGLAAYLLGIETVDQLGRDPLRGQLFENMMVMDFVKARLNQARDPNLYFYRDNHGNEVDLLYKVGSMLIPIEIKISQTYRKDFAKGLNYFHSILPDAAVGGAVVYTGDMELPLQNYQVLSYQKAAAIVKGDGHAD